MIQIGTVQKMKMVESKEFGVYLADPENLSFGEKVLLPKKEVPEGFHTGAEIEVFLYLDSSDRPIATTRRPLMLLGEANTLVVKDVTKIGAFLDWGLERDLFLPYAEQTRTLKKGDKVFVALYLDKSGRLSSTMKVSHYLHADSPYSKKDKVTGTVYRLGPKGISVAVDNRYFGMIPARDLYEQYYEGQQVTALVERVRDDGKLDLAIRRKAYKQMDTDGAVLLEAMEHYGGILPFGESVSPEVIREKFHMSKAAFKRALGHLMKEGKVMILEDRIIRVDQKKGHIE